MRRAPIRIAASIEIVCLIRGFLQAPARGWRITRSNEVETLRVKVPQGDAEVVKRRSTASIITGGPQMKYS